MFGKRKVAVKRVKCTKYMFAEKEEDLLQLSDGHLNVIRYYCSVSWLLCSCIYLKY